MELLNLNKFDVYIVGGYVRDRLLGRIATDHDFVVVGATHEDMITAGFKQVGADFPVYLHPETGDEYALARQERKVRPGYNGFETIHDPSVTLEDDLYRRDLTINAMARKVIGWSGNGYAKLSDDIIDPYNGKEDLENGILRHVSEAFADDPVRVLRLARFKARYNFSVASETMTLVEQLVKSGELEHLTSERVWEELDKAIMENYPTLFFRMLMSCGAIDIVLPGFDRSIVHVGFQLNRAALRQKNKKVRYMILFSNMNAQQRDRLMNKIPTIPVYVKSLTSSFNMMLQQLKDPLTPEIAIKLLNDINAYHSVDNLLLFGDAMCSFNEKLNTKYDKLLSAYYITKNINFDSLTADQQNTLIGPEIQEAINKRKVDSIESLFCFIE